MIAVAVVAIPIGVMAERRSKFQRLAERHFELAGIPTTDEVPSGGMLIVGSDGQPVTSARFEWHFALFEKYERAARRPWLPVEPDPPEPK
jgi:hypothetical protein